ncbi:hypothetical protein V6N12_045573 [Hibiscus sabdariffa]|uniref:Reverse transcriptase/retrotransposon-derived protein RNase H-like domain-containing protein n=1 Tax=Hibiscus sabdariffa TaxID=183260 RepID=A0ABR2G3B3_9ROSI
MVSKRTKIGEFKTVAATEGCLAMIHNKVPTKRTDPGSFTTPCSIGNHYVGKASCDPAASINLMSKSVFIKLGIGQAKPTTVMLQLADRSFVQPEGKIKDILVRFDKFIFLADFLILDCEVDEYAPIFLGRTFLATGRVLIDSENGELILRINDQQVKINVCKSMKQLAEIEDYQAIKVTKEFDPDIEVTCLSREYMIYLGNISVDLKKKMLMTTLIQTQVTGYTTPQPGQENRLINMLRQHKKALGWTIADIKGISPTICMPKILNEENYKPTVDAQRRLNHAMKDVKNAIRPMQCPSNTPNMYDDNFSDMNEDFLEVFMDGFSTFFGNDFDICLDNLEKSSLDVKKQTLYLTGKNGKPFEFNNSCKERFEVLKDKPVTSPIVVPPDWTPPFELMCDASDYAVGAVLGRRKEKFFHPIYYASKTLNEAQINYTST